MKLVLSYLLILCLFLTACISPPLESKPSPNRSGVLLEKSKAPASFFTGSKPLAIPTSPAFIEVTGWYDDKAVMYLQESNKRSSLYKHILRTGESSEFFEVDGWIVDVNSNEEANLFAIKVIDEKNEAKLIILDTDGEEQMNIDGFGNDYTISWNPYHEDQLMMVAYLPDWEFDVFHVDVQTEKITQVNIEQAHIQWLTEKKVAYLNWDEFNPAYDAPLFEIDVTTGEKKKWQDHIIAYMSFPDHLSLTVTVDSIYDLYSKYTFYKDQQPIRHIEIPILNTYSDQWWVPFYTYDSKRGIFYYLRPKYSGDYFSYEDGYELVAYNIEADSEETLTVVQNHIPINLSPEGKYLLMGNRYEYVFDLKTKELVTIWEE